MLTSNVLLVGAAMDLRQGADGVPFVTALRSPFVLNSRKPVSYAMLFVMISGISTLSASRAIFH